MEPLLHSGNFLGLFGFLLLLTAGLQLVSRHFLTGLLFMLGASLLLLSRLFSLFLAPVWAERVLLEFTPLQIIFVQEGPQVALFVGLILVFFSVLLLKMQGERQA